MKESSRTKAELIAEIADLKEKIRKLEKSEIKSRQADSQRKAALEALQESESKFRIIFESASDSIFLMDQDIFIDCNLKTLEMFACTREQIIGQPPYLFSPEIQPDGRKSLEKAQEKIAAALRGQPQFFKWQHSRYDGTLFDAEVSLNAFSNKGKYYLQAIVRDTSDRKQAEEALKESENKYRELVENSPDAIAIYVEGKIVYANNECLHLMAAASLAELIGKSVMQFVHPDYRALVIERMKKVANERTVLPLTEEKFVRFDGSIIEVEVIAIPIKFENKPAVQLIVRNISERKQVESQREAALEALRESEEQQKLILATLPIAIFTSPLDPAIDTSWISGDVEKVTGFTVEQYLAEKDFWKNRLHADDRERVLAAFKDPAAGDDIVIEYRWLCQDGNYKWFYDRTVKKQTAQGIQYFGIILDITTRKQAEAEKRILEERLQWAEKMEAIGTLAGGIAHDFNNLLMGIQGYASMTLLNLDPANPNFERLKRIEQQVQSGADLTNQLLGFARGGRYEVKPTDMNEIIEKTSSMFGRTKKEISIKRKHGRDLWSVEVDRGQMEQVFMNLYVNAWQAMPGGGDICLETENIILNDEKMLPYSILPGKYVKIMVTDTGTGMDEKTRERIFDPFFTTKEMGRGTGLGLATVYGIIKGHRGMINVYSEPGHGTTFSIYLPASDKEVVKEKPLIRKITRGMETILLVEDEKTVMEVNRELLESMGYKVYAVGSGQEGIAVYLENRNKIDLVILDMVMPGISGGEVYDRLRTINPVVKVLLSSGYSLNGEAQHIMDRGCNGFLQKPFQIEKLAQKVREVLEMKNKDI